MKPGMADSVPGKMRRPFTGAWIETSSRVMVRMGCSCRPFTGAWIETPPRLNSVSRPKSPLHGGVD